MPESWLGAGREVEMRSSDSDTKECGPKGSEWVGQSPGVPRREMRPEKFTQSLHYLEKFGFCPGRTWDN